MNPVLSFLIKAFLTQTTHKFSKVFVQSKIVFKNYEKSKLDLFLFKKNVKLFYTVLPLSFGNSSIWSFQVRW